MNSENKEKLLFAINNILENVNGEMLDEFIDHRWCVKDWEDLRDTLTATMPKESKGPLDPHTIEVCMGCDEPVESDADSYHRVDAWGDDHLQFARLISEAATVGVWGGRHSVTRQTFKEMCSAMDLATEDVYEIVERAQRAFALMSKGI